LIATKEDMGVLHQPNATRYLEWLQEHGKCMDHIIPDHQRLKMQGMGAAFAKRFLLFFNQRGGLPASALCRFATHIW
jgi:hypothetical protein